MREQIIAYLEDISENQINLSSPAARERIAEEVMVKIDRYNQAKNKKYIADFLIKFEKLEKAKAAIRNLENQQEAIFQQFVVSNWNLSESDSERLFDYVYNDFPERSKIVEFLLGKVV